MVEKTETRFKQVVNSENRLCKIVENRNKKDVIFHQYVLHVFHRRRRRPTNLGLFGIQRP